MYTTRHMAVCHVLHSAALFCGRECVGIPRVYGPKRAVAAAAAAAAAAAFLDRLKQRNAVWLLYLSKERKWA